MQLAAVKRSATSPHITSSDNKDGLCDNNNTKDFADINAKHILKRNETEIRILSGSRTSSANKHEPSSKTVSEEATGTLRMVNGNTDASSSSSGCLGQRKTPSVASTTTSTSHDATGSSSANNNSLHKSDGYPNTMNGSYRRYNRSRDTRPSRSPCRYSYDPLWTDEDYGRHGYYGTDYYDSYSSSDANGNAFEEPRFIGCSGDRSYKQLNSSDERYNSFYKNDGYGNKYASCYQLGFVGNRNRFKPTREDQNWFSFHFNYQEHIYDLCNGYRKSQCPKHGGIGRSWPVYSRGLRGRGRGRSYSSSLSPRTSKSIINQNYKFKTPSPSPRPSSWDPKSPIRTQYYEESPSSEALTVDVAEDLSGLEECLTLSSFCGFGIGGGLLCLDNGDSIDMKNDAAKTSFDPNKESTKDSHVVHFHINPGTTVNFTNRDGEVQKISGPATVRMVSTNSSPPIPLPVQMPPGHVVQQIVDETGTLQHVILSAQPMQLPVCSYGPNAGQGPHQFYNPPPPHGPPPQGYINPYQHTPQYTPVMSPPLTQPSPPPHNYQKGDRGIRQHEKIRNKFYQQRLQPMPHHNYSPQTSPLHLKTSSSNIHNTPPLSPQKDIYPKSEEEMNGETFDVPKISLQEILSHIKPPELSNIESYSVMASWQPPDLRAFPPKMKQNSDFKFEVFLNKSIFDTVGTTQLLINNLRPGTEYKLHLVCICNGVRGYPTPFQVFCTQATVPDAPDPPRLFERKKQSLTFKWYAPRDNGARITHYILEVCGGHYSRWAEVYHNRSREFCLVKLKPQTTYRFRLLACNEKGNSDYSPETVATTLGLAPPQPPPPSLHQASVNSLTLLWTKRPSDEEFSLEMEDSFNQYGFQPVFCGSETSFICSNLNRNSDYKFRICCQNGNGKSPFSEIVCYRTLPDRPQPPSTPTLKGKPHSDRLIISWAPPLDHGGTPVTDYEVEIDLSTGYEHIYSGSNLECEASNLSPGKTYRVRVLAVSAGGRSRWSDEGVAATNPVAPNQCKPPRLLGKPKAHALQLKWILPSFDGGSAITEYNLDMMTPNNDRRQVYCGRDTDCTVASLLPGRPYVFLLRAVNRIGPGFWSEPFEVVSGAGPPDSPRAPHVACKGPHVVLVSWEEPINNGARIEQYTLQIAEVSSPNTESSESSSTCGDPDFEPSFNTVYTGSAPTTEVRNLTPATTYAFRLSASNSAGVGTYSPSTLVTTPAAPPSTVAYITSTPEASEVALHWSEPPCHGDPITHYNIEIGEKMVSTEAPVLEFLAKELLPETTYKIRIQAVNSVGPSPFSCVHKVTTQPLPPPPPKLELLKASFNSLRLRWGEGRNPDLLKYSLQIELLNPHNNTMEFYQVYRGTNQTFKVGKLDENTAYRLRICAANEAGVGQFSDPVKLTTTKAPPPPLKAPRIAGGPDGTLCVEWCGVRCPGEDRIVYRLQVLQAAKDQDYSLVYTGSETSYIMSDLEPQTGYYMRVCGVRMSGDKEVVAGAYSSPTLFNTPKLEVVEVSKGTTEASPKSKFQWHLMTDHQKALAILLLFSTLAFMAAYVLSPSSGR